MAILTAHRHTGPLRELQGSSPFAFIGPNWFASVMGTGIIATAAVTLPVDVPALRALARTVWGLDVILLVAVCLATALHWAGHRETARSHFDHPVLAHFYGAPAMALMTVGAGALLVGTDVIGTQAALVMGIVLWSAGTALGLWTTIAVPLRIFTRHDLGLADAFGGWLMPVVPPMVSAATGALFLPHLHAGTPRLVLLIACYVMFAIALVASLVVIPLVWRRLTAYGIGAAAAVPTLWIVLGPLGQSVTAVHNLGSYAPALRTFGLAYGIPVWGLAMVWLLIAAVITARTARRGLPFSLTWWSFTFPLGTVVTGTSGLAAATGSDWLAEVAVALFILLVTAWVVVAAKTVRGVWTGALLRDTA